MTSAYSPARRDSSLKEFGSRSSEPLCSESTSCVLRSQRKGSGMPRNDSDPNRSIRVLLLSEQRLIAELVRLTLHHGIYTTRQASTLEDALPILAEWPPQLAIIAMVSQGENLIRHTGKTLPSDRTQLPIPALTR